MQPPPPPAPRPRRAHPPALSQSSQLAGVVQRPECTVRPVALVIEGLRAVHSGLVARAVAGAVRGLPLARGCSLVVGRRRAWRRLRGRAALRGSRPHRRRALRHPGRLPCLCHGLLQGCDEARVARRRGWGSRGRLCRGLGGSVQAGCSRTSGQCLAARIAGDAFDAAGAGRARAVLLHGPAREPWGWRWWRAASCVAFAADPRADPRAATSESPTVGPPSPPGPWARLHCWASTCPATPLA